MLAQRMNDPLTLPSWSNVAMLGYYSLLRNKQTLAGTSAIVQQMRQRVLSMADAYIEKAGSNAFGTVMGQSARDFI